MNNLDFIEWVHGYVQAWSSNEPRDIGRLFAPGATYYTAPFREPWRGREAIIKGWLGRKDESGTFKFDHEILAVDGELAVVRGVTEYSSPPMEYANLWLVRLNDERHCTEFVEYWMERE